MAKRVVHISQLTEDGVYVMALESGDRVLACVASSEWLRDKDGVQNARLIAAAPDLYDFAEKFVVWAEDMPDENYEQVEIDLIAIAKAAIAKAKGKADV